MKNKLKRLTALILALAMCLSLLSVNVWAAEAVEDGTVSVQSEGDASEETPTEQDTSVDDAPNTEEADPGAVEFSPREGSSTGDVSSDETDEEEGTDTAVEDSSEVEFEPESVPESGTADPEPDSSELAPQEAEEEEESMPQQTEPEGESQLETQAMFNEEDILDGGEGTISRGEWLHNLTVMFSLEVDEDGAPDDYFSDLDSSYSYYSDAIACVTYGVIDIEEGEAIHINDPLTRGFAVHTLNYLLGYQLDSNSYTFSDSADCEDPDSAQVAINHGWVELVEGKFVPNRTVNKQEIRKMVKEAKTARSNATVEEGHDNAFEFASDVIVVPEGTVISIDDEETITIQNCPVTISKGDKFAVYLNGIAVVYSVSSVTTSGTDLIIRTNDVEDSDVYTSCSAEGIIEPDITLIQPADGVTITFVDESTDTTYLSAQSALEALGTHVLKRASITAEYKYKVNSTTSVKVKAKLKDPKIEYTLMSGNTVASTKLTGNMEVSFSVEGDLGSLLHSPGKDKLYLFQWGVPGIGGLDVFADVELSAKLSGVKKGKITTGFVYDNNNDFRVIYQYKPEGLSINADGTGAIGLQVQIGLTQMPLVKGYVYGKAGAKAQVSAKTYTDNKLPNQCVEYKAFLYASYGAKGSISSIKKKNSFSVSIEKTVLDEKNSPIRIVKHYEDGKLVNACNRGNKIGYLTSGGSAYTGSGWSSGSGFGFDEAGNPVNPFEYSLDDDGNATITKYSGKSAVLSIPDTIDGYKVVKIGSRAFKDNNRLKVAIIPNSVTAVGAYSFQNCNNLVSLSLPDRLEKLEAGAFQNCVLLDSITIPKTLNSLTENWGDTPFKNCNSLANITIERGITKIPDRLFQNCPGFKTIEIPDTVTAIGQHAFSGCENLTTISIPDSVTEVGAYAFNECTSLRVVTLPKSLVSLHAGAFQKCVLLDGITIPKTLQTATENWGDTPFKNCNSLANITIERGITKIPDRLFQNCPGFKTIEIPDTVTAIGQHAFSGCENLTTISIPDSVTEVGAYAFSMCSSLKTVTLPPKMRTAGDGLFKNCLILTSITLPNSITSLGTHLFDGCTSLKNVTINNSQQKINSYMFQNCTSLETITFPDTVTTVQDHAFKGCTALKTIHWSKSIKEIQSYAF